MIRLGNVVVLGGFLLQGCAAPEPSPPTDVAEEIRDVAEEIRVANGEFMAAVSEKDGEALGAMYTQDAQLLPPNEEIVSGRAAIQDYWQAGLDAGAFAEAKLTTDEAEGFGDTAWEVGRYALQDSTGNTIDEGKYVVIWKSTDAGWKLHRDIWNSSRPMPTE
jgi:ketosteroid isomerase-like protein